MELPPGPSSHHFNARKAGEPGLAEWAQKIRALQRQVDADEEDEHRKLEQEIAASRLARVRRSAGYSRFSFDPAAATPDNPSPISYQPSVFGSEGPSTDTYRDRAEALQKLVGKSSPTLPSASSPTTTPMSPVTVGSGRATGPPLNKQALQKDVTDPTLFEQRTISSSSVPFSGRGGAVMPGLTSRGRRAGSPISDRELDAPIPSASTRVHSPITKNEPALSNLTLAGSHPPEGTSHQLRTNALPAALKRYIRHVEQVTPPPPSRPSDWDNPRPRTVSTPTGTRPTRVTTLSPPGPQSQSYSISPRAPNSPHTRTHQPLPTFGTEPPLSKSPVHSPSKSSTLAFPVTPKKPTVTNASSLAFGVKHPSLSASTPSLPRTEPPPISKATPLTPPPRSHLHLPKEKDPTPSISRLKGRGFVQSMVKVSSALEAAAAGSATSEAGRLGPTKRLSLVADRWKPEPSPSSMQTATTSSAATPSGKRSVAQRKSWAASEPLKAEGHERERPTRALEQQNTGRSDYVIEAHQTGFSTHAGEQSLKALESQHTGRSIRKVPSLPSLSTPSRPSTPPPSSPGGHGIGSSSTLFSYIKPTKTGDDPATGLSKPHSQPATPQSHSSSTSLTSTQDVDELGHRIEVGSGGYGRRNGGVGFPALSGRPLVHLTKGRPKPKKASRKHMAEPLHEKEILKTLTTHVSRSSTASGVARPATLIPSPSPSRDFPLSVTARAPVDSQSPSDTPQTISKPQITEPVLSGIKSVDSVALDVQMKPSLVGLAAGRVLPGIIISPSQPQKPLPSHPASVSPRSPRRQSRIPSTGSRALVMDVAQALQEAQVSPEEEVPIRSSIAPQRAERHAPAMEKRKSSHDKYTTFVMPSLVEERALSARSVSPGPVVEVMETSADIVSQESEMPGTIVLGQKGDIFVEMPHYDELLPRVDLDGCFAPPIGFLPRLDTTNISVDVMSVIGATAMSVKGDAGVFYDSEILAIVHRFKTKPTGLVETSLWSWQGRRCQIGEREERKLRDMARHYGTKLCPVHQGCEPPELVHALGGRLAIRQGTRSRWSAENTTMHQVRWMQGNVFIDEHDLHVSNLCSAFSYCLTLLGTSYVWHGKGSLPKERQAALEYAQSLTTEGSSLVELIEQESDDNEFFWMMLGDSGYASADYWKWRPKLATTLPRIWRVDASSAPYLTNVPALSTQSNVDSSVYLTDCIWELFVLVGTKVRGSRPRRDIRLALFSAKELSLRNAVDRPFTPPIHVLILPSKLPLDFRLHFRDLDEEFLNGGSPPDYMKLLVVSDAGSDVGEEPP